MPVYRHTHTDTKTDYCNPRCLGLTTVKTCEHRKLDKERAAKKRAVETPQTDMRQKRVKASKAKLFP